MKTYHICECCDRVFKTTEALDGLPDNEPGSLTGFETEGIMLEENESGGSFLIGLCDECYEEIYGPDQLYYSNHGPH